MSLDMELEFTGRISPNRCGRLGSTSTTDFSPAYSAQPKSGRRSWREGTGVEPLGRCGGGERHPFLRKEPKMRHGK